MDDFEACIVHLWLPITQRRGPDLWRRVLYQSRAHAVAPALARSGAVLVVVSAQSIAGLRG